MSCRAKPRSSRRICEGCTSAASIANFSRSARCGAAQPALRRGPFRSLGRISVLPRPYQFVPLIMSLRQAPVRLLIADDVGVGKTIEAAMIARELLDRGLAQRLAVLCPAHLSDQWERTGS
jgi:SNF2 family DNA or RNA helicase